MSAYNDMMALSDEDWNALVHLVNNSGMPVDPVEEALFRQVEVDRKARSESV